jgi:hypothetical protein
MSTVGDSGPLFTPRISPDQKTFSTRGNTTDNAEGFKQGAKFGEAARNRQAEGALLKTLLC